MPILDVAERTLIMGEVLGEISTAGYIYDLGAGNHSWAVVPPPRGTRLNCQAAARLAIRMAEDRGVESLQVVSTKLKDGFLVQASRGMKAFGNSDPMIQLHNFSGWEFDNHYRVKDPVGGKVYDPTFGTSGNFNPKGIHCTTETYFKGTTMVSVYGEKYEVTRTHVFEVKELKPGPIAPRFVVDDRNFT